LEKERKEIRGKKERRTLKPHSGGKTDPGQKGKNRPVIKKPQGHEKGAGKKTWVFRRRFGEEKCSSHEKPDKARSGRGEGFWASERKEKNGKGWPLEKGRDLSSSSRKKKPERGRFKSSQELSTVHPQGVSGCQLRQPRGDPGFMVAGKIVAHLTSGGSDRERKPGCLWGFCCLGVWRAGRSGRERPVYGGLREGLIARSGPQ